MKAGLNVYSVCKTEAGSRSCWIEASVDLQLAHPIRWSSNAEIRRIMKDYEPKAMRVTFGGQTYSLVSIQCVFPEFVYWYGAYRLVGSAPLAIASVRESFSGRVKQCS
jgi:hypothetical protein